MEHVGGGGQRGAELEVEEDRRTGRDGTAGWPNALTAGQGSRLPACLPLPGRRVRVRLPGPWLSQVGILGSFSSLLVFFRFVTFLEYSWSRLEIIIIIIIAQLHISIVYIKWSFLGV